MQHTSGKTVLLVDGDVKFCSNTSDLLKKHAYNVSAAHMASSAIDLCKKNTFELIIIDERLRDKTGLELLGTIKELQPAAKFVLSSATPQVRYVVTALKQGADYFLQKPFTITDIEHVMEEESERNSGYAPVAGPVPERGFWETASSRMQNVLQEIELVASSDYSVIIYGESGAGKEMAATLIHQKSQRNAAPFVAVDCGTLIRELAGSAFFGHIKGAFTGAVEDRSGCFEQANGGTLFLDEIGNLPADIQTYLLRAIQEKKFRKIGGNKEQAFDVRVIVASNKDLKIACTNGDFREDLFHRLNEFRLDLPPLRQRQEDILPLANYFIQYACRELNKPPIQLSDEVTHLLLTYPWPGNLRELRNVMRRSCLLTNNSVVEVSVLPAEFTGNFPGGPANEADSACEETPDVEIFVSDTKQLKAIVEAKEKRIILQTLKETKNNKTRAAELLNIDRKTLYNKLRAFGIMMN